MSRGSIRTTQIIVAVTTVAVLIVAAFMFRPPGQGTSRRPAGTLASGHVSAEEVQGDRASAGDSLTASSPTELLRPLMTLPPMMRVAMVKTSLVGRTVRWQGTIGSISSVGDKFLVIAREMGSGGNSFGSRFTSEWGPVFETLARGDTVAIAGRIEDIQFNDVRLAGTDLSVIGSVQSN